MFVCYFLLELVVLTSAGFISFNPGNPDSAAIGGQCHYDDDCAIEYAYCDKQVYCECKENYVASPDLRSCLAIVGARCHGDYDCRAMEHSVCTDGYCFCGKNYVPNAESTQCMKVVTQIKGNCSQDNQCQEGLGETSYCHQGKCECSPGHHFAGECVRSRRLDEFCKTDSQCFIGEDYKSTLECLRGKCTCKFGYHNFRGYCERNSGSILKLTRWSSYLLIFTLIGFIKI